MMSKSRLAGPLESFLNEWVRDNYDELSAERDIAFAAARASARLGFIVDQRDVESSFIEIYRRPVGWKRNSVSLAGGLLIDEGGSILSVRSVVCPICLRNSSVDTGAWSDGYGGFLSCFFCKKVFAAIACHYPSAGTVFVSYKSADSIPDAWHFINDVDNPLN